MQFDDLISRARTLRSMGRGHRGLITLLAALIFVGGVVWAVGGVEVDWRSLDLRWIALVLLGLVPASGFVAAINLQLLARAVDSTIPLRTAIMVTAYGRVAELLPIPGAAIMRGAALMHSGASAADSARIMAWSAVLTLGMAGLVSVGPIIDSMPVIALFLGAGSAVLCALSLRWLWPRLAAGGVLAILCVRIAMLALSVLRIWACFLALGFAAPLLDTAVFVIGGTLTTLIGIVPGGLGISEGISAVVALAVGIPAALAFLTAALNRLLGLAGSGLVALLFWITGSRQGQGIHG